MRRFFAFPFIVTVFAAIMAACTSGPLRTAIPNAPQYVTTGAGSVTQVTVKITIAAKEKKKSEGLRPKYFSVSSKGLLVRAYAHGKRKVLAQTALDISPGSKACGGSKSLTRTCTASLLLAPGKTDDFLLFDYNAKPKHGTFGKRAHLLAYGKLTNKTISAQAKKNQFKVFLGGVVAHLNDVPAVIAVAGDGQAHSVALMVDPVDFGNHTIVAGKKDPYANPIRASVHETGATGHTLLSLNGAPGAKSVVMKYSTDTIEVQYDGGGTLGYGASVVLKASKFKGVAAAQEEVKIAPLLVASTSADLGPGSLALKGNGDYVAIQIGEANAPAGTAFTATSQHCDAIESSMPVTQTSASSGSFAVIARQVIAAPDPAKCVVAVSDGSATLDLVVSNAYKGVLGTPVISETPTVTQSSEPIEIAVGPDGNLWFAECGASQIGRIQPTGTNPQMAEFALPSPVPSHIPEVTGLQTGPDGKIWWTDNNLSSRIGNITTAGVATQYSVTAPAGSPTPEPSMIVVGSDGNLWFSQCGGSAIGQITTAGAVTAHAVPTPGTQPYVALGPDGNAWFTDISNSKIGYVTPGGAVTEIALPSASRPWGITAGPDGAMWFAECSGGSSHNGAIGRIPVGATSTSQITEYSTGMSGHQPNDIVVGPDGALWYTYYNAGTSGTLSGKYGIGRIDTSGTITEYAVATASANPWGMTSGPDGAVWFTENGSGMIARVKLQTSAAFRWPHAARRANPFGHVFRRRHGAHDKPPSR